MLLSTKQTIKAIIGYTGKITGASSLIIRKRGLYKGVIVLNFHRVVTEPYFRPQMAISREAFANLLDFLVTNADVIDLLEIIGSNRLPYCNPEKLKVALTFDDGYRDNFDNAFPELLQRHLPATIFLTTGFIDNPKRYLWWDDVAFVLCNLMKIGGKARDEILSFLNTYSICFDRPKDRLSSSVNAVIDRLRVIPQQERDNIVGIIASLVENFGLERPRLMLTWDEIRKMAVSGFRFGGHTVNHPRLDQLSESELRYEILTCKKRIEEETKQSIVMFAYPYGRYSSMAINILKQVGYQLICTSDAGFYRNGDNLMLVPRISISGDTVYGPYSSFSPSVWHFQLLYKTKQR